MRVKIKWPAEIASILHVVVIATPSFFSHTQQFKSDLRKNVH